jgi:hypothetical protein
MFLMVRKLWSFQREIGSSKDLANPNNQLFNVSEYGLDLKLNLPNLHAFLYRKIIKKSMIPSTSWL